MKHPKLVGADVYVVRLARPSPQPTARKKSHEGVQHKDESAGTSESDSRSTSSDLSPKESLHDELSCKGKQPDPPMVQPEDVEMTRIVAESRPCYRCISYMNSVGIKRVFWTTSEGKWEGSKVRDLVDQFEGAMDNLDSSLELSVFVTKHEVLLLRRLMVGGDC